MIKYFRRCGKLTKETYVTSDNGNPNLMLLKFDSAFASTATAGKGFSLTVSSVGAGKDVSRNGTCITLLQPALAYELIDTCNINGYGSSNK